ncbi:MAG: hypothetical protein ACF8AM_21185 [Rhodopirellula sp. JB055]|uniref:hypothetical protein n=1 Tax=Rhodopirellula sp. JB055 TaxID=3342846 RepID=UPI00370BF381
MPIPEHLQRRVAYVDILTAHAFNRSVSFWRDPTDTERRWSKIETLPNPLLIGPNDALDVDCDSNGAISAPDGSVIHINGNLNADLEPAGHYEIVISGNVGENATIRASGFCHVYIGGPVFGRIESADSCKLWIDGDFNGTLLTGHPSNNLHVSGDFNAAVRPINKASLLFVSIDGFARHDLISNIASVGYTVFNASIGASDVDAGLYPEGSGRRKTESGASHFRWCVQSRRERAEQ